MLRKCRICLKGTWNFVSLFQRKPFHQGCEEARVTGQLILQWHSITKKKKNYNTIHWFTIASQEKKQKWLQIAWREVFLNKEKNFIMYRLSWINCKCFWCTCDDLMLLMCWWWFDALRSWLPGTFICAITLSQRFLVFFYFYNYNLPWKKKIASADLTTNDWKNGG